MNTTISNPLIALQVFTTWALKRYNHELQTSEMFSTAGRTVKSGLVASAVVSSWTWAATLLQSTSVAFRYGVSGPLWYAAGASVQILLFATVAIELKRRAPNAHVSLSLLVVAHVLTYIRNRRSSRQCARAMELLPILCTSYLDSSPTSL
jgi:Na+/proline symporter